MEERTSAAPVALPHRVLIVDDRPELRVLIRARLRMIPDVEVVGEASNGAEALILVSALAPRVVVLDLDMPVMNGEEAIPRMRALRPGLQVLLYAADEASIARLNEAAQPDAVVMKGRPLSDLVDQLSMLLEKGPYDVLRLVLAPLLLPQTLPVYDRWVGLNVRILESLARGDELLHDQLGGATLEEFRALIGLYAHLADNLQRAAGEAAQEVVPVVHLLRTTAAAARRALLAFNDDHLKTFYAAWDYDVSGPAARAIKDMRDRLIEALPTSSADGSEGQSTAYTGSGEPDAVRGHKERVSERTVAAVDRAAAAIDRAAAAQDRAAASLDELTGTYLRGPGHVELKREIARARRTMAPLTLAFIDVDGLKAVNDNSGHQAGDQLLRDVAAALRDHTRDYDVIVRHGGDEFLCALPGMSIDEARVRMERIHHASATGPNSWSISAGLAMLEEGDTLDSLIHRADAALYGQRAVREARAR